MRKLMILGGSRYAIPVIKKAHELGLYVITADYLPDNIAHRYSDEYVNVSIVDMKATFAEAKLRKIDGIMSFACDPGVITAAYIAEEMGLPSVGSYEAVSILQNKGLFRRFLTENGFNVPVARSYKDKRAALKDINIFNWPVIVKPTDAAGSKGVTKVDNPELLRDAINHAIESSLNNEFIIEDYLEKTGCSSDSDSFSINGVLKFVSFNAQRFDVEAVNPYAPAAYSWPSTMSKEHENELRTEIQRLFGLLGLRTSIYNIETRECTDGKAYIMECSPRGGGNRLAEMIEYATGVDLITAAIHAAMGDEVKDIRQGSYSDHWAEVILHSDKQGSFEDIWIDESIKENIVEKDLWIAHGDHVEGFAGANNAIGTLVLRFDNEYKMLNTINNVKEYVKVITK